MGRVSRSMLAVLALGIAGSWRAVIPNSLDYKNNTPFFQNFTSTVSFASAQDNSVSWNILAKKSGDTVKVIWFHHDQAMMEQGIQQGFLVFRSVLSAGDSMFTESHAVAVAKLRGQQRISNLIWPGSLVSSFSNNNLRIITTGGKPAPESRNHFADFKAFQQCHLGISDLRTGSDTTYLYTLYLNSATPRLLGSVVVK